MDTHAHTTHAHTDVAMYAYLSTVELQIVIIIMIIYGKYNFIIFQDDKTVQIMYISKGKTCCARILQWINNPKEYCNNH